MAVGINIGSIYGIISLSASGVVAGVNKAITHISKIQVASAKMSAALQKHEKAVNRAFVGIAAGMAVAVKSNMQLNKEMANIATLVPRSEEKIKNLKKEIQDLSVKYNKTTSDLAGGAYQIISAFGEQEIQSRKLEIATRSATAGMAETKDAINLLSAVTKGYGDTSDEAFEKASDLAFQTVKLGQTTFPELAASMGKVIPIAAKMNVPIEELFGAFATLTGVTGDASEVATQLSSILTGMAKPSQGMIKAFQSLEVATGESMIASMGFQNALNAIINQTDKTSIGIGKLFRRVEGLRALLTLSGNQAEVFSEKSGKMYKSASIGAEAFNEVSNGVNKTGFQFEQAMKKIAVTTQHLGEALTPVLLTLTKVLDPIIGILGKITSIFGALGGVLNDTEKSMKPFSSILKEVGAGIQVGIASLIAYKASLGALSFLVPGVTASIGAFGTKIMAVLTGIKTLSPVAAAAMGGLTVAVGYFAATQVSKLFEIEKENAKLIKYTRESTKVATNQIKNNATLIGDFLDIYKNRLSKVADESRRSIYTAFWEDIRKKLDGVKNSSMDATDKAQAFTNILMELRSHPVDHIRESWEKYIKVTYGTTLASEKQVKKINSNNEKLVIQTDENIEKINEILNKSKEHAQKNAMDEHDYKIWTATNTYQENIRILKENNANEKQIAELKKNYILELEEAKKAAYLDIVRTETEEAKIIREKETNHRRAQIESMQFWMQEQEEINSINRLIGEEKRIAEIERWNEKELSLLQAKYIAGIISQDEYLKQREEQDKKYYEKLNWYENDSTFKFMSLMTQRLQKYQMYFSLVSNAFNAFISAKQKKIDAEYENEKTIIEQTITDETERKAALEELETKFAAKKRGVQRSAAIAEKATSISTAIINTAVAATKAYTAGPIIGPILAGIITALGLGQIALIASTPIPMAVGGKVSEDGTAYLHKNEVVMPYERAMQIEKSIQNNSITNNSLNDRQYNITIEGDTIHVHVIDSQSFIDAADKHLIPWLEQRSREKAFLINQQVVVQNV